MAHEHKKTKVPELEPRRRKAIERHVARYVAPAAFVIHEIVSEIVHVDVHLVPPGKRNPFWFLYTTGMSALPMTMPECAGHSRYAELSILLPPTWRCDRQSWSNERWFWPLRWLRDLARLPHRHATWLGFGHTIPNEDPPRPFDRSTQLAGMLVLPSVSLPEEVHTIAAGAVSIELFTLWPIHRDEMELKLARGVEALLDAFDAAEVVDIVDPDRPSALRTVASDRPFA